VIPENYDVFTCVCASCRVTDKWGKIVNFFSGDYIVFLAGNLGFRLMATNRDHHILIFTVTLQRALDSDFLVYDEEKSRELKLNIRLNEI